MEIYSLYHYNFVYTRIKHIHIVIISGGSRNFKTGGRGPGAVKFLGLAFVLTPLHTYPMCL